MPFTVFIHRRWGYEGKDDGTASGSYALRTRTLRSHVVVRILVVRSVSDVLRAQSRFVKFVGGEAAGRTPYTFYKPSLGPKYVSNRPYNEFITPTTFI